MITLVEFLQPVKSAPQRLKCMAVLYYYTHYKHTPSMTSPEVKSALLQSRLPKVKDINTADVLSRSGAAVDTNENNDKGHKLWHLTDSGTQEIRDVLGLPAEEPEIAVDVATLGKAAKKISDDLAREFVEEAITCLQVGALRSAVVFAWTGAVRTLHDRAASKGWPDVQAAVQKHDARVKSVKKVEDFAAVGDKIFLLAARDLALIDKGQWTVLQQALDLRNQCGHPSKYRPGPKKVSALIEDLISVVFT